MSNQKAILEAIIVAYRQLIEDRYQYDILRQKYPAAEQFGEERINRFRHYFLNYVYPPPEKRAELDSAFDHLDDYIKQPQKLLRIVVDSARLMFRYGRSLPKILRAGLQALKSFRTGSLFERKLSEQAQKMELSPPLSTLDISRLIAALPKSEIDQFIKDSQAMLHVLHDRPLVKKIIDIVEHLIKNMQKRPNLYSKEEIRGLEIGRDIIKQGNLLFEELTTEEQYQIFDLIIGIERDFLEQLFNTKDAS